MLTSVRFGPADHGRQVCDDELSIAEFRPGYDYEVIFGRLYVSSAPDFEHDWVEKFIFGQIFLYSNEHPEIVAYVTDRARVFVTESQSKTVPEPDLAVYSKRPTSDWRDVTPIIIAEVLRGEDVDKDLFRNVDLYWRVSSIQEYWVFDIRQAPQHPTLIVHRRQLGEPHSKVDWDIVDYSADSVYETSLLPGLRLKISPPTVLDNH
ncbi:MAG: Uma2 family endonuclease [Planctomycetes bacterium]|nr:Uma2 family endonuclease [Planctomycetota bacterium]